MQRTEGSLDEISMWEYKRRDEGEYAQKILEKLQLILQGAYVTDPCKESLVKLASTYLNFGVPPQHLLPLQQLGIDFKAGKYGIFDPNENLGDLEGKLLKLHDMTVSASVLQGDPTGQKELNKKWHEAYIEQYQTPKRI